MQTRSELLSELWTWTPCLLCFEHAVIFLYCALASIFIYLFIFWFFFLTKFCCAAASTMGLWDLADQFQQISLDMLQTLFFEREAQSEASVAQRLLYCLCIMSDYFKFNGRQGTQQSLRLIAAQILERFESVLDDSGSFFRRSENSRAKTFPDFFPCRIFGHHLC